MLYPYNNSFEGWLLSPLPYYSSDLNLTTGISFYGPRRFTPGKEPSLAKGKIAVYIKVDLWAAQSLI
jgi:hypothetical protein